MLEDRKFISVYAGSEVDDGITKVKEALTTDSIVGILGQATDLAISQQAFTNSYQYAVKTFVTMPTPTADLLNTVALYTGETVASFTQSHIYQCQASATVGYFEWVDITVQAQGAVLSVNGKTGVVVLTAQDVGAISESALQAETLARQNADTNLQNQIDNISSVKILNKGIITSTYANIQTTCTNYIVTQYGRQPKNLDGLIITITDSTPPNDKVQYVYSPFSLIWVDTGSQMQISDATTTAKGIVQIGSGINISGGVISTSAQAIGLGTIVQDLTNEIANREQEDTLLQNDITDEIQNRTTADTALSNQIALKANNSYTNPTTPTANTVALALNDLYSMIGNIGTALDTINGEVI